MIRGIDISHYQSDLSMARAKAAGAAFAINKATQDTWTDSAFARQLRAGKAAGLVVGAYHFLVEPGALGGGHSATAQADAFISAVKGANGGTLDGVLLALDVEPFKDSSPSWGDVRTWVARFRAVAGKARPLFIYTRGGVWTSYKNPRIRTALGTHTYLWSADWTAAAGKAWSRGYGGLKPTIHQHGPFPGLRPRIVDGNVFAGTAAQLRAYTRPKVVDPPEPDPPPEPEPEPEPEIVDRWCHRFPVALLLPGLDQPAVAAVAYGAPLRVETGRSGTGAAAAGSLSSPFVAVIDLAGRRQDPPWLVAALDLGELPPPPQPPCLPPTTPPPPPAAGDEP